MVKSNTLARKYQRIGYKIVAFSFVAPLYLLHNVSSSPRYSCPLFISSTNSSDTNAMHKNTSTNMTFKNGQIYTINISLSFAFLRTLYLLYLSQKITFMALTAIQHKMQTEIWNFKSHISYTHLLL